MAENIILILLSAYKWVNENFIELIVYISRRNTSIQFGLKSTSPPAATYTIESWAMLKHISRMNRLNPIARGRRDMNPSRMGILPNSSAIPTKITRSVSLKSNAAFNP